jgi:ribonuclease HI
MEVSLLNTTPSGKPAAHVIIHTDGACKGNPGPGGWAAILTYGATTKEIYGSASQTTNNRMEMRAVIHALDALKRPCRVTVVTDSEYVRRGMTEWIDGWIRKGWRNAKKEPVKNTDLWKLLLAAVQRHAPAGGVSWSWIKGHAGHTLNERADQLASQAALDASPADPVDLDLAARA